MTITRAWDLITKIVEDKRDTCGISAAELKAYMFMDRLVMNYKKFLLIK